MTTSSTRRPGGLRDTDLVARMHFLRLFLPAWGILFLGLALVMRAGGLPRATFLLLAWVAAPLVAAGVSVLGNALLDRAAAGLLGAVFSSGGERHSREYSEQQALVAAGRIAEAVDAYRAHLVAFPGDVEARLRLAALLAGPAGEADAAERLYLEVRTAGSSPRHELVIGNALIDLYRAAGRRSELKAELARFARVHHGTAAAEHARGLLRHLVEEEHRGS